ncbi:hypothetical protein K491DRAFT_693988 [Lophiostoma macrostomum CBS 122681]|uniref:Pre-rRNA-processing protein RIX1 n=1 Tax=Lophiostoma macrostomum CBS 122681 TaxID=1314788 RepID=A0A6A6T3F9_9PLEO|nr:hypothetical protein K491DRAFT_693988 [Lophiostoma macrostomum CBS 122681]
MSRADVNASELSTLKAVSFRLSSAPTPQLPQQIPAIAALLANCKSLLSSAHTSGSKTSSEASVAVHKYRTLLAALLQDRTVQGRWSAVVLIKSTIEIGGWETLQKCLPWVRGLLGILSKPDPPSSKKLCIITLTRIFTLTRDFPTLVREITTPSLSTFIQTCLQIVSSKPPNGLLQAILGSFAQLLPRHPTVFRTYAKQLQQILAHIIGETPSSNLSQEQRHSTSLRVSSDVSESARRLFVQLPCCAPKGASSEEWNAVYRNLLLNIHQVADRVFRAVIEDWKPSQHTAASTVSGHTLDADVCNQDNDTMELPPWLGIYAGGERLVSLLQLLDAFLVNHTTNSVVVHVGPVLDLITRLTSMSLPSKQNLVRFNNPVTKDERESLWNIIPHIHVSAIEILATLSKRFNQTLFSVDTVVLDQIMWVFRSERVNDNVRTACYVAVADILYRSGPTIPKSSIEPLATLIRNCCDDLLAVEHTSIGAKHAQGQGERKSGDANQKQALTNADTFLSSTSASKGPMGNFLGLQQAAYDLLPVILSSVPPQHLPDSVRTRIDRTAILTKHKDAMTASVLNPPPSKKYGKPAASILPLLARSFPIDAEVEALLRPRMPAILRGKQELELDSDVEDGSMEEPLESEEHFVGEELDTLLESASQTELALTVPPDAAPTIDTTSNWPSSVSTSQVIESDGSPAVDEASRNNGPNKRQQSEEAIVLSPSKRVKVGTKLDASHSEPHPVTTTLAVQDLGQSSVAAVVPVQSDALPAFVKTSAARDDGSDGEDDFGELVLGQDSDEESES